MAHRKAERCLLWLRLARPPRGPGSHVPQACLSTRSLLPYLGRRCEICDDGYFGDPLGISGAPEPCRPCQCSGNVDPNAVGNCDSQSGHCLRCLHNTTGAHCERCQDGFYGSALAPRPADRCTREFPPPAPRGSVGGGRGGNKGRCLLGLCNLRQVPHLLCPLVWRVCLFSKVKFLSAVT